MLLTGAVAVGVSIGLVWQVRAVERSLARAAAANLRRGLAGQTAAADGRRSGAGPLLGPIAAALGARARRFAPQARQEAMEVRIATAGLQGRWTLERVMVGKFLLAGAGAFAGLIWLSARPSTLMWLLAVGATALGWFVPELVLKGRADERRATILQELPDLVDRICLMVEAGLGFERALARTARSTEGVLAEELARAVQDVQLGTRLSDALQALADRADVPEVRRVVSSLRQAERYGVPVAHVLRTEGSTLRDRQEQLAEERAQKVPVKLLIPLVFCILPALLIVLLAPAALNSGSGFGG